MTTKLLKISECKERIGTSIHGVTGIVQKVYPRKTGETVKDGKKFAWSIQNGELSDDTGIIRFTVFNAKDEMSRDLVAQEVTFLSTQGRGGLSGVSVVENEYKGNKTIELKIDKNSTFVKGTPDEAFKEAPSLEPQGTAKALETKVNDLLPKRGDGALKLNVDDILTKYRILYQKCRNMAIEMDPNDELSATDKKDIASCFFIQSIKDGLLNHINTEVLVDEPPF
jgi:hypothetical protein